MSVVSLPATRKQREVYDALVAFRDAHGRPPTRRELMRVANVSGPGRIQVLLEALRERGLIDWLPNKACSIEIMQQGTGYALPVDLQRRLEAFCARTNQLPRAVIADLIELHLDEAEPDTDELRAG